MKNLTYIFLVFGMLFIGQNLNAQRGSDTTDGTKLEIKANPIGILFGNADLAVEFILSENFGLELAPSFNSRNNTVFGEEVKYTGFGFGVFGRYYFNPDEPASKFSISPYVRFARTSATTSASEEVSNTRLAGGFMFGYKWVSSGPISFELGLGAGRAFINNWEGTSDLGFDLDAIARLAVGYRL